MTTNFAGEPITWRHDYAVKNIELSPWLTQTLSREEINLVKDKLSALIGRESIWHWVWVLLNYYGHMIDYFARNNEEGGLRDGGLGSMPNNVLWGLKGYDTGMQFYDNL